MGSLSALHIGAVGIGAMIFNFIYWNFGFLRMGTTGLTAQAYGAGDHEELTAILTRALFIGLTIALVLMVCAVPVEWLAVRAMNTSENQVAMVRTYFFIRLMAAPATLCLYAFFGWFFGLQNALIPLVITICINVCNIILSVLFVLYFHWEIMGVAISTVAAQYFGLLLAFGLAFWRYKKYLRSMKVAILRNFDAFKKFMKINMDIFLRTVLLSLAFAFFYAQSSGQGEIVLAVNVILLQLVNWMSYGIDGFAFAAESLVGKYKGRKNDQALYRVMRYLMIWGFGLASAYALAYGLGYTGIMRIFTDDPKVLQLGEKLKYWVIALPLFSFLSYMWDGIFIGLTASRAMRDTMILSFVCYVLAFFALRQYMGIHALWLALNVFLLARGIFQTYWFKRQKLALS